MSQKLKSESLLKMERTILDFKRLVARQPVPADQRSRSLLFATRLVIVELENALDEYLYYEGEQR